MRTSFFAICGTLLGFLVFTGFARAELWTYDFTQGVNPHDWITENIGNTVFTYTPSEHGLVVAGGTGGSGFQAGRVKLNLDNFPGGLTDFEAVVTFTNAVFTPGVLHQVQLDISLSGQYFCLTKDMYDIHVYRDPPASETANNSTTATHGTFRLTRSGGAFAAYWNGSATPFWTATYGTGPVLYLGLALNKNSTSVATEVTWTRFSITPAPVSAPAIATGHLGCAQNAYLKASNTGEGDLFGISAAISGDTAIVGAPGEDSNATGVNGDGSNNSANDSGAAYVFVQTNGAWYQQAYLKASNTGAGDSFGAVDISGDTAIVGAPKEDDLNYNAGAAYVFVRANGVWSQQAVLRASNAGYDDQFGYSVAVSGDSAIVGALYRDSNGANAGAAYIFARNEGVWSQQAYLTAANAGAVDCFGVSVDISGDTAIVGANLEDGSATGVNGAYNDGVKDAGAAYIFSRSNGVWSQQAYVKASNTAADDYFGYDVAIDGETAIVSACGEDSNATGVDGDPSNNSVETAGAAYVFARTNGIWYQQAYLKASNTGVTDYFGYTVEVSGDAAIVGALFEDGSATGVNGLDNNGAPDSGAAYVFRRSNGTWSPQAYLKPSNTGGNDYFGAVALSGGTAMVGAYSEDGSATGVNGTSDDESGDSGAAYTFQLLPQLAFEWVDHLPSGPHARISWRSLPGQFYQAQESGDLIDWIDLGPPLSGDGRDYDRYDATATQARRFYRLLVQ